MKQFIAFFFTLLCLVFTACKNQNKTAKNSLEPVSAESQIPPDLEAKAWVSLMDTSKWRGYNQNILPDNWKITDQLISCYGKAGDVGGDIISTEVYENFELYWEWKISAGGNSGVFYHVVQDAQYHSPYQTGPEYQLIDDIGFPTPLEDWQKTAANYAMHPAHENKVLHKVGEWNSSRIIFNHGKVSHFLNGTLVVSFDKYTAKWQTLRDSGKWIDYPDYGLANSGYLGLQDHGSGVWFRDVKVRSLD